MWHQNVREQLDVAAGLVLDLTHIILVKNGVLIIFLHLSPKIVGLLIHLIYVHLITIYGMN